MAKKTHDDNINMLRMCRVIYRQLYPNLTLFKLYMMVIKVY